MIEFQEYLKGAAEYSLRSKKIIKAIKNCEASIFAADELIKQLENMNPLITSFFKDIALYKPSIAKFGKIAETRKVFLGEKIVHEILSN